MSTPGRNANISITQGLTPVRFLESPKIKTSTNDANFAVCKSRLETVTKTLQDNFAKWQLAQKRGLSLCYAIEGIKTKCLKELNKGRDDHNFTIYPAELQILCDKLAIITSIFVDITKNTREILKQLRSLNKLPGSRNEVFFRSWGLAEYVEFVEELVFCYEKESIVKKYVKRELPHCKYHSELIRCTSAWEYPQYVDNWIDIKFVFLKKEIK